VTPAVGDLRFSDRARFREAHAPDDGQIEDEHKEERSDRVRRELDVVDHVVGMFYETQPSAPGIEPRTLTIGRRTINKASLPDRLLVIP